jgi:glyoxylase-like metal-dependent hydrolase (beta-lactamase superfamily II)
MARSSRTALLVGAIVLTGAARAEIETFHVQGNVYMLIGAGANIAVQTGEDGVLVVDTGAREAAAEVLAAIRRLSDKPIRWIINTHAHADHTGGNETISQAGITVNGNPAAIIAHERVLARMSEAGRSVTELPLTTFFEEGRDFYFNGEAIFLRHVPGAHTDGDILVYFRGSDVLVAGDIFVTTTYPVIDREADGGIEGFLVGLNTILDITVPRYLQEGGTYVVPGHGRVADEADVVEYRDMVLFIRERVRALRAQGMTLEQIMATGPALDYEPRYDKDGSRTPMLIEAVYETLEP